MEGQNSVMVYSISITYIIWNIITFTLMGIDKRRAQQDKWRISEATLLVTAFAMGGAGSLAGSQFFHHKTRKWKFKILLPMAICCNFAIGGYVWLHI